jgi:hypothetical protein
MTQQATAQVLPFTPKPPSFGDMLGATKTTTEAPKKGKMPTLEATPEVKEAVDQYQEAKTAAKQAEAIMEVTGPIITGFVRDRQDLDGYAGKFTGSYAVMGNKATCKVVYANKFSLSAEDGPQLAEVLGPENYGRMITQKASVTLKAEVFENEAMQKKLMGLLGESFPEFFETKITLAVTEGFNRDIYRVVTPEKLADLRVFARQYKPSIR